MENGETFCKVIYILPQFPTNPLTVHSVKYDYSKTKPKILGDYSYMKYNRGLFIMIDQKFELCTRASIQPVSWERLFFSNDVLTVWKCFYKSSKEFDVFFKLWGNFDPQLLEICRIPLDPEEHTYFCQKIFISKRQWFIISIIYYL